MIVVNPSSGDEGALSYVSQLYDVICEEFQQINIMATGGAGDAEKFAKQAAQEKYDSLFILGGDGTVNEGINGIVEEEHRPDFGIIPLGTTNNYARMLGLDMDPLKAIQQYNDYEITPSDIGRINDLYFISTVSAGSVPESVQDVPSEMKTKYGTFAYLAEGFKALESEDTYRFEIDFDGEKVTDEFSTIVIAVGNSVYGFANFFADGQIDDGKLYFMGLRESDLGDKLSLIPEIVKDNQVTSDFLYTRVFEKASINMESKENHQTTVDGNEGPEFPVEIIVLPRHINMYSFLHTNKGFFDRLSELGNQEESI